MTPEQLKEIKDRLEAATPGPWRVGKYSWDYYMEGWTIENPQCITVADGFRGEGSVPADVTFIAHAPSDIAALLGEVERLQGMAMSVIKEFEDALGYVPEYFRNKYEYDKFIAKAHKVLAGSEP